MNIFRRIVREPLVHFLFAGIAIFIAYRLAENPGQSERAPIVVSEGRVKQLAQVFAKTWQRPPTEQELRGLVEAFVKEEIYYREALKQGLDRDDTLIRRRMQQKMEFLSEPPEDDLKASDEELAGFLKENREDFRIEPQVSFRQIFINPNKSEIPAGDRARRLLAGLSGAQTETGIAGLGDPTLLPSEVSLSPLSQAARNFGDNFAKELAKLPPRKWSGPVHSPYGLHLVFISERRGDSDPPFEKVRDAVEKKWRSVRREEYMKAEYEKLRASYEVILPTATETVARQEGKTE